MFTIKAGIKTATIYGGTDKNYQLDQISNGVDILIATPGRLIDFLESRLIN